MDNYSAASINRRVNFDEFEDPALAEEPDVITCPECLDEVEELYEDYGVCEQCFYDGEQ